MDIMAIHKQVKNSQEKFSNNQFGRFDSDITLELPREFTIDTTGQYDDNLLDIEEDDDDYKYFTEADEESAFNRTFTDLCRRSRSLYLNVQILENKFKAIIVIIICCSFLSILLWNSLRENEYFLFTDQNTFESPLHKIIIPFLHLLYPDQYNEDDASLFDPRFAPAALLLYLQNHLFFAKDDLKRNFTVSFSWDDWIDIDSKLQYDDNYLIDWLDTHSDFFQDSISEFRLLDCKRFAILYGCEGNKDFDKQCVDSENTDQSRNYPYHFKINGPTKAKIKEPGRVLYSASYLKFNMPPPERLFLLNLFENDEREGSLIINVNNTRADKPLLRNPEFIKKIIQWDLKILNKPLAVFFKDGWNLQSIKKSMNDFVRFFTVEKVINSKNLLENNNQDETFLLVNPKKENKIGVDFWKFKEFVWEEEKFLNELSNKHMSTLEDHTNFDYRLYQNIENKEDEKITKGYHSKYLLEADLYGTNLGSHYDWRFFSSSLILNDHRQSIIHRLSRTWLRFCFENRIKTFIAYGSMLGWIRNGLTLPWDGDIDVIVTMESLNLLARNFNQTLIVDYSDKDGFQAAMGSYLLDINPAYYSRVRGDGNNVIDGRLIDITTGVYLDITALAWSENYLEEIKNKDNLKKLVDKDFEINQYFALEGGDIYAKTLLDQLETLQNEKQLIHCKNDNAYKIEELAVMIPSYFEGVRAYFPHQYERIIWRLYPKALTRTTEPGHLFDPILNLWINTQDCPGIYDEENSIIYQASLGTCNNSRVLTEYELTKDYTSRHFKMLEENKWGSYELTEDMESKPMRIDEFFVLYAARLGMTEQELIELYK